MNTENIRIFQFAQLHQAKQSRIQRPIQLKYRQTKKTCVAHADLNDALNKDNCDIIESNHFTST